MDAQEKLILELATVIYSERPSIQPWNGEPYGFHELGAEEERSRALKTAEKILEHLASKATAEEAKNLSKQDGSIAWEYGVDFREGYVTAENSARNAASRVIEVAERREREKSQWPEPRLMKRLVGPWTSSEATAESFFSENDLELY